MPPLNPAAITRRPRAVPVHVPATARRRQDFYAPIVDPAARTISLWRLETLIGSLIGIFFLPALYFGLWAIVRICG